MRNLQIACFQLIVASISTPKEHLRKIRPARQLRVRVDGDELIRFHVDDYKPTVRRLIVEHVFGEKLW